MDEEIGSGMRAAVIEMLLDECVPLEAIPLRLALRWPDVPALRLCLELASGADAVGQILRPAERTRARIEGVWRIAALIGADVYLLQVQGRPHDRSRDLAAYWLAEDPLFGKEGRDATGRA
jgi:hypothetical protein